MDTEGSAHQQMDRRWSVDYSIVSSLMFGRLGKFGRFGRFGRFASPCWRAKKVAGFCIIVCNKVWCWARSSGSHIGECCLCWRGQSQNTSEKTQGCRRETYVFETIEVLIPLAANFALERLLLLHTQRAGIRSTSLWVDDGEGTITILMQLLGWVTMGLVVPVMHVSRQRWWLQGSRATGSFFFWKAGLFRL
jgi:hypothetical protein